MNTETKTDHVNNGIFIRSTPLALKVKTVVMKFTPDRVDDAPSMTIPPMKAVVPGLLPKSPKLFREEYGGYITQVMSAASPDQTPVKISGVEKTRIHRPRALILGNARSYAPICRGRI